METTLSGFYGNQKRLWNRMKNGYKTWEETQTPSTKMGRAWRYGTRSGGLSRPFQRMNDEKGRTWDEKDYPFSEKQISPAVFCCKVHPEPGSSTRFGQDFYSDKRSSVGMEKLIYFSNGRAPVAVKAETMKEALEFLVEKGVNLFYADLAGENLSGANLSKGKLNGANFEGCLLDFADFKHAEMEDCDFSMADLSGSDFTEARLDRSTFYNTDLSGAFFRNASVTETSFSDSDLYCADFCGSNFEEAVFENSSCEEARF